jgi:hypothetical protein
MAATKDCLALLGELRGTSLLPLRLRVLIARKHVQSSLFDKKTL